MFSTTRYAALGVAFCVLTCVTIVHTVPRIEAEIMDQTSGIVSQVNHMVVSVDGRNIRVLGKIRSASPQEISAAVHDLIDALDDIPAVDQVDASIELLSAQNPDAKDAAAVIRT